MKCLSGCLLIVLFFSLLPLIVQAKDDQKANVSYEVQPRLDTEQKNRGIDYFYSQVRPNETKSFSFEIKNHSTKEATFKVEWNKATTNKNGFIDYSIHNIHKQKKVSADFNDLVKKREQIVTVPAQGSKVVTFTAKLPSQKFSGIVLGGIYVTKEKENGSTDNTNQKLGIKFDQQLAYAIAVMLQEEVPYTGGSNVKLQGIKAIPDEAQPTIRLGLENERPNILNDVKLEMKIYQSNQTSIYKTLKKEHMSFAPNNRFNLYIPWKIEEMKPGEYEAVIEVKSGKKKWTFRKSFTITKDDNTLLKEKGTPFVEKNSMSIFISILLGLLIITIIVATIIILRKKRK